MRVVVVAVGKLKDKAVAGLVDAYGRRLRGVTVEWVEVAAAPGKGDKAAALAKEAERLRARVPPRAAVAALSEKGREFDSKEFAAWLGRLRDEGRDVRFLIGGADGLDPALVQEARHVVSLSRLTFPHELVRAILAEQIYRAFSILANEPYHRE